MKTTVAMFSILWLLCAPASAAGESRAHVIVRIHDYAGSLPETIAAAQRFATDVYAAAGIDLHWLPPLRHPAEPMAGECDRVREELSVIVRSLHTSERGSRSLETMGFAPIDAGGGGRVAYVLLDRIEHAARGGTGVMQNLLGLVIAHELGHLLLPRDAHAPTGLMRERWHVSELWTIHPRALGLTPRQAEHIRTRLGGVAP